MNKLQTLSRLQDIVAREKKRGKKIILANGCFDLIHVGHIRYLTEARSRGDLLVLALNSDASVRRLKGPGRPVLNQEERSEILSALSCVDHIVLFDEPNVENILLALRPDVHAKGSDYSPDTVPEKSTSKKIGTETAIAGGPKIRNTSDIIRGLAATADRGGDFLLVRLSSLGDIIHALPAFSALRRNLPEARIAWAVEPRGKALLELVRGLDRIIVVEKRGWKAALRSWRCPGLISLDFQGLIKSGFMSWLSGAKRRIGFARSNLREPLAGMFYTERPEPYPESDHVIRKNLHLLSRLGIRERSLEFPMDIPPAVSERVLSELNRLGREKKQPLVVVNVGAAWETKRWFPDRWSKVLRGLKDGKRFLLLLWGNALEKKLAEEAGRTAGVPLAPDLNVPEVLALIKEAGLVISGDTFALQAACALGVPVVGIFGPTSPRRNGPFAAHDVAAFHEIACSRCYRRACPTLECLKRITPEEVIALVEKRLGEAVHV